MLDPTGALFLRAVEARLPFHETLATFDDWGDVDGGDVVAHRRRLAEQVGVEAFEIGMAEELLADHPVRQRDPAHRAHLVAGLAVLDHRLALDAGPGIMIEGPNDLPHLVGRMVEDDAVIGSGHGSPPWLPASAQAGTA